MLCVVAAISCGCSPQMYGRATYESDNMYGVHDREAISKYKVEQRAAAKRAQEQREQEWAEILGYSVPPREQGALELVDLEAYQTPYGQKLLALSSGEYQRPQSYYGAMSEREKQNLATLSEYDPDYYNAVLLGDGNISVSPKYVNSMYGVWGDLYSPWAYGYMRPARGWGYYSMWGYPNYSWWGWNSYGMGFGYSPYYDPWWGYSPYYGNGYYGWYPPRVAPPRPQPRRIVRQAQPIVSPSVRPGVTVEQGKRRRDGSTVGTSSPNVRYNRGGEIFAPTPTRPSVPSTPSVSTPRQGNSLGR